MGFGGRPPPQRRPYREPIPNISVRKGEPVTSRRPRLDYRSTHEHYDHDVTVSSQHNPPGYRNNVPIQYQSSSPYLQQDAIITGDGSQGPQWQPVVPMYVLYPNQEQYSPPTSYSPLLIPVAPAQGNFQSPSFAETSSLPVYSSAPYIQPVPEPALQSYFVSKDLSQPNYVNTRYTEAVHIIPESQQSGGHSLQQQVPVNLISGHLQHPSAMSSHPNTVTHQQSWLQSGWVVQQDSESTGPQHLKYSQMHSEHKELDMIRNLAFRFVEEYCPLIGNTAYCHPPVYRSRHPDKASKQLMMGMESEQRVIRTFERFFAANQMPVFMLCHYPVLGFLQEHHDNQQLVNKESKDKTNATNRETVTLILLSPKFCATAVTVSIISSNSDFSYIQRQVGKAAGHMAKCGRAVSHWLTSLGLAPDVREVLAFPNLRQSMMQRIARDKALQKSLSKTSLLHLDDLSPPFEEEWSTPSLKRQFSEWMQKHVLCRPPSLSLIDIKLFVGAMLCPQLSFVENMRNVQSISPIPENPRYLDKEPTKAEDIGQLQLTINGVTMGFDDFMEKYVSSYYPDVDTKTYRVPPLHFNIQSFQKGTQYLKGLRGESSDISKQKDTTINRKRSHLSSVNNVIGSDDEEESADLSDIDSDEDFMPSGKSYCWQAGPVTGRQNSAYNSSDDDSSDSGSVSPGYRRLPVERVTLDSISNPVLQVHLAQQLPENPNDVGLSLKEQVGNTLTNTGRSSSSMVKPNGSSVVMYPQIPRPPSSTRDQGDFSVEIRSVEEHLHSMMTGIPNRPASLGVSLSHLSKPITETPSMTKEEAQVKILDDTSVMSDVMAKDARADEGENRVINAMELLGQKFGPMFIICSYQYNNYLNKLREEMFTKGEATRPTRAFGQIMRAEHDCLIFHKNLGVLVVCIKAIGDNFSDWNASQDQIMSSTAKILHKALKQLEREEAMIRHVTSDLKSGSKLVCHCLVALPNMYRRQVDAALATDVELYKKIEKLTYGRGTKSFLCLDELPEKNKSVWDPPEESVLQRLVDWWKDLRQSLDAPENAIDTRTYKHIIGRYCGLLSTVEVWSPNNPRVEVRSMSEAVNLCAHRYSQVVLLPTQLQVLVSEHNRIYLYGPPGSGKTMLLLLKAREWLLRGHTVILINPRWGSTDGYPYAYGLLNRLKFMMTEDGVPHDRLEMINVDTSRFHPSFLSYVLPTRCVIIDEVTPATLPIIEHLSCLQVQNIWCAGLFLESRPHTAHHFHAVKMEKVLRCPPIVQSLLKHTENDAKFDAPYKFMYEESSSDSMPNNDQMHQDFRRNVDEKEKELKKDLAKKKRNTDATKKHNVYGKEERKDPNYDVDALNGRLAKLGQRFKTLFHDEKADPELETSPKAEELETLISNRDMHGLPTDGPRPHIIDHEPHNQPGAPANCPTCGKELADFLLSMVKSDTPASSFLNNGAFSGSDPTNYSPSSPINSKNRLSLKGDNPRGRTRKGNHSGFGISSTRKSDERINFSGTLNSESRQRNMFDNRALSWSDVLIVMSSMSKNCALLKVLQNQGIPLEVVASSQSTRVIETSKERQRLFVTTYREVIGLERALIVFVPSGTADNYGLGSEKDQFKELRNLNLRKCLQRYNENDRKNLWYMASRCLSDLVLLLP